MLFFFVKYIEQTKDVREKGSTCVFIFNLPLQMSKAVIHLKQAIWKTDDFVQKKREKIKLFRLILQLAECNAIVTKRGIVKYRFTKKCDAWSKHGQWTPAESVAVSTYLLYINVKWAAIGSSTV